MNTQTTFSPESGPEVQPMIEALGAIPPVTASWLKQAFQIMGAGVLALASYLFISHFVLQSVQVVGSSMDPTLHDSDRYFLNRWVYRVQAPQRSDIVVIRDPTDGAFVVKRIIAMPGEMVHLKNGGVYVNGSKLSEPYVSAGNATTTGTAAGEELILCGKDQYFVLGDNRENSFDSRMYGPVRRENILGAVIY